MSRTLVSLLAASVMLGAFWSASAALCQDAQMALEPSDSPQQPIWNANQGLSTCNQRWWFDAEYLLLWTNGNTVPPLITTNASIPPRTEAGVLGIGDTHVLLGGELDQGGRSGVSLAAGLWLDQNQCWGLRAEWFEVGDPSDELDGRWQSLGEPVLARPFFNAGSGQEDAQLVAYPGVIEGQARVATSSDLQSAEALLNVNWKRGTRGRMDVLGGYRYLRFREGLRIEEHLISRDPGGIIQIGTTIDLYDRFATSNTFHGGEVGLLTSLEQGSFGLDIAAKLGLGNVQRQLQIDGATRVVTPAGSQASGPGGLLALPSNMGRYEQDQFAFLPELNLTARWLLTDCLSVSLGYDLLFLTGVFRTGSQIDRSIDTSQLPGFLPINDNSPAADVHPVARLDDSTLRAQGLRLGLTLTY